MASPSTTKNNSLLANTTVAAGATASAEWDGTASFEFQGLVKAVFGGTPDGDVLVEIFRVKGEGTASEQDATEPSQSFTITSAASTTKWAPIILSTGGWRIVVTNQDSTDSIDTEIVYDEVTDIT